LPLLILTKKYLAQIKLATLKKKDTLKNMLTIEEVLDKNKDAIAEEKPLNEWRITPNAAPVYFIP
jgi:hypothetical protein